MIKNYVVSTLNDLVVVEIFLIEQKACSVQKLLDVFTMIKVI